MPDLHDDELVVYDRTRRKVAYEVVVARRPRLNGIYSISVQSDGKVAALLSREGRRCEAAQLVWSKPSSVPRLRIFRARPALGSSSSIELLGDRLMFARALQRGCSFVSSELVVEALDSSARRVLGHYDLRTAPQLYLGPTFDYDGQTSLFSEGTNFGNSEMNSTTIFVDEQR